LKRGKVKDLYLSSHYHFRVSMGKKLFIYLVGCGLPAYLLGQVPREEVVAIRNKLQAATSDSVRFTISMDLSQAYRFSNIDSALYYTDQAIQMGRKMKNMAREADGLSQKGFIVLETGNIPQSLQYQLVALQLSEKFSDPITIGFIINRIGNVYTEIGDYKKAIETKPQFSVAYYNRSLLFLKQGRNDEALKDISKAIEQDPAFYEAYYTKGIIHYNQKNYDEAISNYSKAIDIKNDFAQAYYNRGLAEYYVNKKNEACADLKQATSLGFSSSPEIFNAICK